MASTFRKLRVARTAGAVLACLLPAISHGSDEVPYVPPKWHQIPLSALHYFENGARASWEMHDGKPLALLNPHVAAHHMRVVGWDVPNRGYRDTGWTLHQLPLEVNR